MRRKDVERNYYNKREGVGKEESSIKDMRE